MLLYFFNKAFSFPFLIFKTYSFLALSLSFEIKRFFFFSSESQKDSKDSWLRFTEMFSQASTLDLSSYHGNINVSFFTGNWRKQEQVFWCPKIRKMDTGQLPYYKRTVDSLSWERNYTRFSSLLIKYRKQWLVNIYHANLKLKFLLMIIFLFKI